MKFWRMAMSEGQGPLAEKMFGQAINLGVAAITYDPLIDTDLSQFPENEPKERWSQLAPSQRSSLRKVAYEMAPGDIIFLKNGPEIIDRGTVIGPYQFDSEFRIRDKRGRAWPHQVPVRWSTNFQPVRIQVGTSQLLTVQEITREDAAKIDAQVPAANNTTASAPLLTEDDYLRASPALLKHIIPKHNKLSNDFREWLDRQHKVKAIQEHRRVDVRFHINGKTALAELKICCYGTTTGSIREALGQIFEYNHYPSREVADTWLIILDSEPSDSDKLYISALRGQRSLPLTIGWQTQRSFAFHPKWPE